VIITGGTAPYKYNWVQSGDTSNTALNLCLGNNSIIVTDSNGCKAASDIEIKLSDNTEKDIIVPNVFTPNSDGFNDAFEIKNIESTKDFNIQIFNRWGCLVYESSSVSEFWDGKFKNKPVAEGVYFYTIKYIDKCSNKIQNKNGNITILR
jgi:gliding motility-associated-like protein